MLSPAWLEQPLRFTGEAKADGIVAGCWLAEAADSGKQNMGGPAAVPNSANEPLALRLLRRIRFSCRPHTLQLGLLRLQRAQQRLALAPRALQVLRCRRRHEDEKRDIIRRMAYGASG